MFWKKKQKQLVENEQARLNGLPKIGLVLDGGGARGPFQLGVYLALEKFGLRKKIVGISGASIGGFMAVMSGYEDITKAYDLWKNINQKVIMPLKESKLKALTKTLTRKQGMFSRDKLCEYIKANIDLHELVNNVSYPIYLSLAQLVEDEKGKEQGYNACYQKINGMSSEEILTYLLATSAIPYVFDPVKIGNNIYVDPMKADNEPVQPLLEACPTMDMVFIVPLNNSHYKHHYDQNFPYPIVDFEVSEMMDQPKLNMLDFTPENAEYYISLGYQTARLLLSWMKNNNLLHPLSAEMLQKSPKPYYSLKSMGITSLTFAKMSLSEVKEDSRLHV